MDSDVEMQEEGPLSDATLESMDELERAYLDLERALVDQQNARKSEQEALTELQDLCMRYKEMKEDFQNLKALYRTCANDYKKLQEVSNYIFILITYAACTTAPFVVTTL